MKPTILWRVFVSFCALALWVTSCGQRHPYFDRGRELVNAAGLSTQDTLAVLQKGADVNRRSESQFGWTPLISAIYARKGDIVDLLLAYGADPNIGDADNRTAIVWAVESWGDNTNLLIKLMQHGANPEIKTKLGTDAFAAAKSQSNATIILEILKRKNG